MSCVLRPGKKSRLARGRDPPARRFSYATRCRLTEVYTPRILEWPIGSGTIDGCRCPGVKSLICDHRYGHQPFEVCSGTKSQTEPCARGCTRGLQRPGLESSPGASRDYP